jgi:Ca2+-binding RTX toxin-like protein
MTLRKPLAWFLPLPSAPRGDRRRPLPAPALECLERRELKDGGISLIGSTVDIAGSAGQNTVVVSYTDPSNSVVSVSWNNLTVDYLRSQVTSIVFTGQNSFNSFYNFTNIASTASGGNGENVFYGGTGADTFAGGDGVNVFWGNGTHDSLTGGNGTNIFFVAPDASDTLVGGNGTNIFIGVVGGNDSISVGKGVNLFE